MTTSVRPFDIDTDRHDTLLKCVAAVAIFIIFLLLLGGLEIDLTTYPAGLNLHLAAPIDAFGAWVIGHRATHPIFVYGFEPISAAIDGMLRAAESLLLALPWPVVVLTVVFLAYRAAGWGISLFAGAGLLFMGLVGLWPQSMQTLALMAVSVLICLIVGVPLGILAARYKKFDQTMRPILDAMQTMPAFVYLIPVLLFFGVARVPSVVATVIYALPPAIRFTTSGIRQVPPELVEAADAFGSTAWQRLRKVQLPLAMPSILAGLNQVIMMALGMAVIAALIGAGGLGREVLVALQRLQVGKAMEAGLAIVFLAIILDRISYAYSQRRRHMLFTGVFIPGKISPNVSPKLLAYFYWSTALLVILYVMVLDSYIWDLSVFPAAWRFSIQGPVDAGVRWMRDNLYQVGDLPIGTGPLSDFLTIYVLNPLRSLLQDGLPWPAVILGFGLIGYLSSGWRLAVICAVGVFCAGLLGVWSETMDTLSQVLVAVAASLLVALPLGVWSARNDKVRAVMRPVLDFLQTIPVFVYLVPVIMLFHVGRVPGVIASILYAIPPAIRLTELGIRRVPDETVEAADAFGSTASQKLFKVELPLALPSIMLGVNQTVMMVLSMVIIAGLVGGGGLGFEAVNGLAKSELGRGVEAGLAIVILAMILDRITQAWTKGRLS